jgi:Flp pilus assembly protein TadG
MFNPSWLARWRCGIKAFGKRLRSDERGSELVEFVLVLPILAGVLYTSFQIWQIVSLKTALRHTTAQAVRYVSAFAKLPDRLQDPLPPTPAEIEQSVNLMIETAMGPYQSKGLIAGTPQLAWFRFADPNNPAWNGNAVPAIPLDVLSNSQCADQFALQVKVVVPWRTVFFGFPQGKQSGFTMNMTETSVGALACAPDCQVQLGNVGTGCAANICWNFTDCSFMLDAVEVWVGGTRCNVRANPGKSGCIPCQLPPGTTQVRVRFVSGGHFIEKIVFISGC